ncbi:uncharacterized protein SCHCODRAFT_02021444 [Schizophyllum commune H4-8]|nr:uncharacterized protein SCHCODRAFT_02021444 [Schizophyllum commune H4-8]KAI5899833.1 hypothetical protein SCHCODRAFT_02021444 [Schizophyllum commune H4-8]
MNPQHRPVPTLDIGPQSSSDLPSSPEYGRQIAGSQRVRTFEERRMAVDESVSPTSEELRSLKFDFASTPPDAQPFGFPGPANNNSLNFDTMIQSGDPEWASVLTLVPNWAEDPNALVFSLQLV